MLTWFLVSYMMCKNPVHTGTDSIAYAVRMTALNSFQKYNS